MKIFINYFRKDSRNNPFNLAVIRVLLGIYLLWRVMFFEWKFYHEWPSYRIEIHSYLFKDILFLLLPYIQSIIIMLLILFIFGVKTKFSGGFAAIILLFVLSVRASIYMSAQTESLYMTVYVLLLFSIFHNKDSDILSADAFWKSKNISTKKLSQNLSNSVNRKYKMSGMKWSLIIIGLGYFSSATAKLISSPIERWLSGTSIQRDIIRFQIWADIEQPMASLALMSSEIAWLGEISNLILQISFLIFILLKLDISFHALGLIFMHIMIALILGYVVTSLLVVLLLFASWDSAYKQIASGSEDRILLVFNENYRLCMRILYMLKHLDINESVDFCPHSSLSKQDVEKDKIQSGVGMCVFRNDQWYSNYWALCELLRQFQIFQPLVWMLKLPPIAIIGSKLFDGLIIHNFDSIRN